VEYNQYQKMLNVWMSLAALAKEREGAGREPCDLRNSELGSLPAFFFHLK
jgi:hypothetical protein